MKKHAISHNSINHTFYKSYLMIIILFLLKIVKPNLPYFKKLDVSIWFLVIFFSITRVDSVS